MNPDLLTELECIREAMAVNIEAQLATANALDALITKYEDGPDLKVINGGSTDEISK